ncbi:hypothetical protein [Nonlabens marinus]|uniref:Orphan protein signal peptide n=1 Tax=Nonlabens marinus S1-08 TaxID=1454201 RepID=W8VNK3_9FLAO|nr:hypothetical protein [Nonlabens marinus]BAO54514.1 hypothetical protein NMS_0505 [Nonlabens marinus S1-08]
MKLFLTLFLCCFFFAFAKAQSPQIPTYIELPLGVDQFYGVDDFNNLYYGKKNVIYKRPMHVNSNTGAQQFYDVQLGDLTSVDLINPLRILLFYKDTQTVVLLDNRLNESLRISLSELQPYRYFEHSSLAGERRLWLYNQDQQRLELVDYVQNKLIVSSPIIKDKVSHFTSDYNYCFLITDESVLVFNSYASRTSKLDRAGIQLADYDFEQLVVWQDDQLKSYAFTSEYQLESISNSWDVPEQVTTESFYLKNGKLYIYALNRVSVFTANQNKN